MKKQFYIFATNIVFIGSYCDKLVSTRVFDVISKKGRKTKHDNDKYKHRHINIVFYLINPLSLRQKNYKV